MTDRVSDTKAMIAGMDPVLTDGLYVFCTTTDPDNPAIAQAIGSFRETEGLSLILPMDTARDLGFDTSAPMACITLMVQSSLEGVGLTAAVVTALSDAGIACNMVAAFHHDHAFVPQVLADKAIEVLIARAAQV